MSMNEPQLDEKDFISPNQTPQEVPLWVWFFTFLGLTAIGVIGFSLYQQYGSRLVQEPFFHVTNRQFTVFLWSNPKFARQPAIDSLTGFHQVEGKMVVRPGMADRDVDVPPEVLFCYHLWDRLLGEQLVQNEIGAEEFREFLKMAPEWLPKDWREAPAPYIALINSLPNLEDRENLQPYSFAALPSKVRQAFYAWKTFFKDEDKVREVKIDREKLEGFLAGHPRYTRPFWRNILPEYLASLLSEKTGPQTMIPSEEMPFFLKMAIFNTEDEG